MTPVEQFARHYIQNMGFGIVPLAPRSKRCLEKDWPNRAFVAGDVSPASKIGLRSIDGLVVLDDDFPTMAPKCDAAVLPPTGAVWGRPAKPTSKRLYRCPDLTETITFTDIDGSHLLQLRVGLQDMAPPSIHPDSGERLRWSGLLLPPPEIPRDRLVLAVRYRWTIGLLAKYWPERGRHNLRLAYARVLLDTLDIPYEHAQHILTWVCRLGGSDAKGIQAAEQAISSTKARLAAQEQATGGSTVINHLGDTGKHIIRLLRKAYGKTNHLDEAIESLNANHAIVSVGSKVVVMETWADGGIKVLWPFEEFKRRHTKDFVEVAGKRRRLADVWLEDSRGRTYDRLVYVMPGSAEELYTGDYNGYLGFTVEPTAGDWSRNREHIHRIICGEHDGAYVWLINWMAALVQQPGRHAFSAVVLRGGQGIGKGHFGHQMLGALFHQQQYLHVIGGGMLTGRFNEHLSGKVLVFADESTWGGDPAAADKLKGIVTESTIPIERKFLPLVEEPSALHIVIASNNDWPISIPLDDRRFMVLDVADSKRQDDSYFGPLREELAAGGLAAMLHDLLAHTVDEHALRHPPSTAAKRKVMAHSLKPIERWWFEKLQQGALRLDEWPKEGIQKAELHEDFMLFLDRHRCDGRTRRATETELGQFLRKHVPKLAEQRSLVGGVRERFWLLPPLDECRAAWVEACHWPADFDWEEANG